MSTVIRPEISVKNKYYIEKHRYYELKHFCLQYRELRKTYMSITEIASSSFESEPSDNLPSDPTSIRAIKKAEYAKKIQMIEQAALETDEFLYFYILKAVTEGLSYTYLKTKLNIPCGRDMYYDRYRRFFWLLSEARD